MWKKFPQALVGALLAWWLWIPLAYLLWLLVVNVFLGGFGNLHVGTWARFDRWFAVDSGQRWVYFFVGAVGTLAICVVFSAGEAGTAAAGESVVAVVAAAAVVAGLLAVASVVMFVRAVWDNDKDLGRFYGSATTFVVPDVDDPPAAVAGLFDDNASGDGERCDLLGPAGDDVYACIAEGTLPEDGWEPRAGSLEGARLVMARSSGSGSNVELMDDTFTYLSKDEGPAWSAVRDGSGWDTPLYGVVEWTGGTGEPTECLFSGDYGIDRAFDGSLGNSMMNLVNDRFGRLLFDTDDVWGYCDDEEPVVVMPAQHQVHYKQRTVTTAAGVVIVRGSPSGGAVLEYRPTVRVGELPGPVYPSSLVEAQRDAVGWAGGRRLMDRQSFGFEPGSSSVQQGNDSDYLLRGADDGRLYWVTPAVPRDSDSQQFVAYEVVPADEVVDGELNPLTVYVLGDDDPRVVNLEQLVAGATDYLAGADPGLVASGGRIVEFLPVSGDVWQGYVEIEGRVVYRITLSYSDQVPVELVALEPRSGDTPPPASAPGPSDPTAGCGGTPEELSDSQLVACIQAWAQELAGRGLTTVRPDQRDVAS